MSVSIKQAFIQRAKNRKAKYKVKYKIYQDTKVTKSDKLQRTTTGYSKRIYRKKKYSYWHRS